MDDPRLASARLHADVDRLRAQAALFWQKEADALARLGLRDGMTVLEPGSGPGFLTELLLERWPSLRVTAIDLDPQMSQAARERLGQRASVVQASILNSDLPSNSFDFAFVRLVLQHVAAPELALMEILRLLKPGGTVAVIDIDDDMGGLLVPHLPSSATVADAMRRVQHARAGDREIGRKLWRLLARSGFVDVKLETLIIHSDEIGLEPFLPQYDPERYRAILAPDAFEAYCQAFELFIERPPHQPVSGGRHLPRQVASHATV